MSTAPPLPPLSSRHPIVIGALEALRAVLVLAVSVLVVAIAAWFTAIAQLQPLSAVLTWAGTLIAAASGWELTIGVGLPPTLLTIVLLALLTSALSRTRRALAANELLVRNGALPATRYAATIGITTCVVMIATVLLVAGLVVGTGEVSVVGCARFLVVVAVPVLIACLGPERRGAPAGRWAQALLDTVARRAGAEWADASEAALRVLRRVAAAWAIVSLLGLVIALVTGWSSMAEAVSGYSHPTVAAVGLGIVQLLYAPTLLVFVLSWVSGAGIHLNAVAHASPFSEQAGLVPAVPVLAAIPTDASAWGWAFLAVLPVAAGIAAVGRPRWADDLDWRTVVLAVVLVLVCATVISVFATGPIGPSGLGTFGVPVLAAAGAIGAGTAAGVAAGWGLSLLASRASADR
ncbi:cell division protein PerM [Brevibacterium yomogidense]|uniref:cell division protein PerM n=1 Tax=Brevibacterium yomogidense TaxID=946573 RepID=UPI0018DF6164|nr:DUF6350 family protein [Brevibacterium yomogidense]